MMGSDLPIFRICLVALIVFILLMECQRYLHPKDSCKGGVHSPHPEWSIFKE